MFDMHKTPPWLSFTIAGLVITTADNIGRFQTQVFQNFLQKPGAGINY
jgi:hypothetical protein